MKVIPKPEAIAYQALLVIGGAVLAAWIIGRFPTLRAWVADQWGGVPK